MTRDTHDAGRLDDGGAASPGVLTTGDESEFRDFVTAHWNALVATAFLVTADRHLAEDCVQNALVNLHRHWNRVRAVGDPYGYARKAALNSALSWRRRRRVSEVPLDRLPDVRARLVSEDSLDPELTAALLSLPPRMRAVVALRFVEDQSEAETARLLGCTVGTVKSTAHKGLAKLRAVLGAAEGGPLEDRALGARPLGEPAPGAAPPGGRHRARSHPRDLTARGDVR